MAYPMNLHTQPKDFTELLTHDKEAFDAPIGWQSKNVSQSPLVTSFPQVWSELRETYQRELSQLAFTPISDEKAIVAGFTQITEKL